ncbi:putative chloride channel-like protein clc-g [Quercus suber]|uniref:Chloride channel-like protein clc-g n=1 Tax=Quercus suber TaxID=58331 RepID=A0AAW0IH90_QUESU
MATITINSNANGDQDSVIVPLLSVQRTTPNSTSQVAIVGSKVCPIESLDYEYGMAFFVFATSNFVLTLFAAIITAFISPAAAGSGIPEVKAYLNGVDAPGILSLRTLVVKVENL